MDIDIIYLVLLSLMTAIITHILILERRESHFGPFQDANRIVLFPPDLENLSDWQQPVTLFDWIRRLFGVYTVKQHVWYVNPVHSQRWTCPICLSFWIALVVTGISFYYVLPENFFMCVLTLFSVYAMSAIVNVNWL